MSTERSLLTILDSVDSTNNYAMGQVNSGLAEDGNAWLSMEQREGKGRRNKGWYSEKGANILLSISVQMASLEIYRQFELSMAVALGCHDLFSKYAGNNSRIKWPNDIYYHDNKAGGILIENVIKGKKWQWAIIGVGMNINQVVFDKEANNATSLKLITGKEYDIIELGKELQKALLKRISEIPNRNIEAILEEYNRLLYKRGEKVKLKKENIGFDTIIKGVTAQGQLLTSDTMERSYDFDEVQWILNT
jgi:BirA family transcriptional regulator, biotin operon repressor / biotin---[acetyl-CoA-carboxylase] ligase